MISRDTSSSCMLSLVAVAIVVANFKRISEELLETGVVPCLPDHLPSRCLASARLLTSAPVEHVLSVSKAHANRTDGITPSGSILNFFSPPTCPHVACAVGQSRQGRRCRRVARRTSRPICLWEQLQCRLGKPQGQATVNIILTLGLLNAYFRRLANAPVSRPRCQALSRYPPRYDPAVQLDIRQPRIPHSECRIEPNQAPNSLWTIAHLCNADILPHVPLGNGYPVPGEHAQRRV